MMRRVLGLAAWLLSLAALSPSIATAQDLCQRPVERFAQIVCPDAELVALYGLIDQAHAFDRQSPRDMSLEEVLLDQETWVSLTQQQCDLAGLRPVQPPQRRRLSRCARQQFSARLVTLGARLPRVNRTQPLPPSLERVMRVEGGEYGFVSAHANVNVYRDPDAQIPIFPSYLRIGRGLVSGPQTACAVAEEDVLILSVDRALPLIARGSLSDFTGLTVPQAADVRVILLSCQFGELNPAGAYALSDDGQQLLMPRGDGYIMVFERS